VVGSDPSTRVHVAGGDSIPDHLIAHGRHQPVKKQLAIVLLDTFEHARGVYPSTNLIDQMARPGELADGSKQIRHRCLVVRIGQLRKDQSVLAGHPASLRNDQMVRSRAVRF
jgi:hypothetical protein